MKKKLAVTFLILMTIFFSISFRQANKSSFVPGEVLVKFRQGYTDATVATVLSRVETEVIKTFPRLDVWQLKIKADLSVSETVNKFNALSNLASYRVPK